MKLPSKRFVCVSISGRATGPRAALYRCCRRGPQAGNAELRAEGFWGSAPTAFHTSKVLRCREPAVVVEIVDAPEKINAFSGLDRMIGKADHMDEVRGQRLSALRRPVKRALPFPCRSPIPSPEKGHLKGGAGRNCKK
jgi:hypothetical protein